jgi:hypothetical protein
MKFSIWPHEIDFYEIIINTCFTLQITKQAPSSDLYMCVYVSGGEELSATIIIITRG